MSETVIDLPVKESSCSRSTSQGDLLELDVIYENCYQSLYQNVFLITRCEQTSEDIVQDVFINLWIKRDRLNEIKDIHAYLYHMGRNFAIDHLRRKKIERRVLEEVSYRNPKDINHDSYFEKELNQTFNDAVALLPCQQKLIYQLKKECGWRKNKIAKRLNISPNTVRNNMQNALKGIKKYIIHEYYPDQVVDDR